MKRVSIIILILCICFTQLAGCSLKGNSKVDDETVKSAIIDEFTKISEIPRESGHVKAISTYLRSWAKENEFDVVRDGAYNVIINKPATKGYENAPTTILQCNMDTTLSIDKGVLFDPLKDSVSLINDNKTITAEGTSFGADSGIGMATALYVLKNAEAHGPLRVIFTANAENSMSGAKDISSKHLKGDYLINLGGVSDDLLVNGCPGTVSYEMTQDIAWESPKNAIPYVVWITGLEGGNAKMSSVADKANAIKTIGEALAKAQGEGLLLELATFNGGMSKDTIPTTSSAIVIINESDQNKFERSLKSSINTFKDTYKGTEENFQFSYSQTEMPQKVMTFEDGSSIVSFIYGIVNGVQTTSKYYDGVIESSSNIGYASTNADYFKCEVYAKSLTDISKQEITGAHQTISSMCGLKLEFTDSSPRWSTNPDGKLITSLSDIYSTLYSSDARIEPIHGELECGWLIDKNPDLEIVSIGPLITDANTADEALVLSTVTKPANMIISFLKKTK